MEITVKIPDGDYCNGCKFLNYYTHRLVDMMGNETGNVREGYECKYYNCHLEIDEENPKRCGCISSDNVKKYFLCNMTEQERNKYALAAAIVAFEFLGINKNDCLDKDEED